MELNYGMGAQLLGLNDLPDAAADYSYIARKVKVEQLVYILGEEDPKEVLMKRIGNVLDALPVLFGPRVLVATAPTPLKKSTILQTQTARDKAIEEGRWQGKCACVLKLGVGAFKTDPRFPSYEWEGPKPEVGDFVYFRTSDAWETGLRVSEGIAISARIIYDSDIQGIIRDVEAIF
jgi:hypothetical protein